MHQKARRPLVAFPLACLAAASVFAACNSPAARTSPTEAVLPGDQPQAAQSVVTATSTRQDLAAIRKATARFQNIDVALAAGYVDDGFGCADAADFGLDPSLGAMGFHLINEALHADPATDPLRPDLLVYEPARGRGKPKLVALEYEVFRSDWYAAGNTEPPTLLGHEFVPIDFEDLHVFGLHVWLWRNNPAGMFEDFNPKLSCP